MSPAFVASRWGRLPTRDGFAVVCPAGEGERLADDSWGAPGQISDLARMPAIVQHALPWIHIDRRRVYAVGPSMGGQEALLLAAQYPDRIAAAVSIDGVADLATHFREMPRPKRSGRRVLRAMDVECGGTPAQQPFSYALRSPLCYAENLAFDGVPVELWWSRRDQVVVDQGARQSGLLYRTIRHLNPTAPVREVVTDYRHCAAFCPGVALRQVVAFLRPHGRWRNVQAAPPPSWCLRSGFTHATLWGYSFRAQGVLHSFWEVRNRATGGMTVQAAVPMVVTLPYYGKGHFARLVVGARTARVTVHHGFIRLALLARETRLVVR